MYADLNDSGLRVASAASPHFDAMLEEAAEMTSLFKDDRQPLLASCLRNLSRLEEWNRIAMGKRYVADDEIELGIAVVRRLLYRLAETSTAAFHPVHHQNGCPACHGSLSLRQVGGTRQIKCCEPCFEPVRKAIRDLASLFCLGTDGVQL
jgi:hypothetical protein